MNPTTAPAPPEAVARFCAQSPQWEPAAEGRGLERCVVHVPLDYADPAGPALDIAVGRIPALDSSRRRGVLVVINGGPGGHNGLGRTSPLRLAGTAVHEVYDLIGFDPRGWAGSAPVLREVVEGKAPWSSRPADADFEQIALDAKAVEEGAVRGGGDLRAHITTRNVARDLDVIRAVLGEEKISILGYSDGTYTGTVYGTMFAERVDRHVLDSSVNPGALWREQYRSQAPAIRRNVDAWADWTGRHDEVFGLGRDGAAVLDSIESVGAALAGSPLGGVDRTVLDGLVGIGATHRPLWDQLAYTVAGLRAGDFAAVQAAWLLAAPEWERPEPGATHTSGVVEAITSEGEWPADVEVYFADMRDYRERYPYGYGVLRAQPWVAAFRTREPREPMTVISRDGYGPGLVVHAEGNPTLSYLGGQAMAERLGDRLITVADDGSNELFGVREHAAVDALVTAYLVHGLLPHGDVTVAGSPRPEPSAAEAAGLDAGRIKQFLDDYKSAAKARA